MELGKNVICEKPMEIQLDRIDQMIAAAKKNNVHLAGIFQNRWLPANIAIKEAADTNRFGRFPGLDASRRGIATDQYYVTAAGAARGRWTAAGRS